MMRIFVAGMLLAALLGPGSRVAGAQGTAASTAASAEARDLQARLQSRFTALPIAQGVVLTPKFRSSIRSVELSGGAIAIDGAPVTGAELRDRLGADAGAVLALSYMSADAQREVLGLSAPQPATPQPVLQGAPVSPEPPAPPSGRQRETGRVHRDQVVRFGGNVTIPEGEIVDGDVAVFGGNGDIDGEVQGDVAVIGGSLRLGPHADVQKDVTVIGGRLDRDPGASIGGKLSEVGVGDALRSRSGRRAWRYGPWFGFALGPYIGLAGTLVRVGLVILLAGIVLLVARRPVQQIAERAAAEPFKSWVVGFLAELLFLPVLVLTVVVLAVSLVGIPLLVLVPVAIVAILVVGLVGFTGVAYQVGRLLEERLTGLHERPFVATALGIVAIVSPLLLGRLLGVLGFVGFFGAIFVGAGMLVEYVAWTMGFGAAALARLTKPQPAGPPVSGASPDNGANRLAD